MKTLLLTFLGISAILLFGKRFIFTAKRNLFKDQAAWSGKELKIKYNKKGKRDESNNTDNYLNMIANESKLFLDEESKKSD